MFFPYIYIPILNPGKNMGSNIPDTLPPDAELKAKRLKEGLCPTCGESGDWRPPGALVCKTDGWYAGC